MRLLIFLLVLFLGRACVLALDLSRAVVVIQGDSPRVRKAAVMLVEEVEKRSGLRWEISKEKNGEKKTVILLHEKGASGAEGFTIRANEQGVQVDGNDE